MSKLERVYGVIRERILEFNDVEAFARQHKLNTVEAFRRWHDEAGAGAAAARRTR